MANTDPCTVLHSALTSRRYVKRTDGVISRFSTSRSRNPPSRSLYRFLIPDNITVGQFLYILRKRVQLPPKTAMFLFVNGSVPPTGMMFSNLYENKKDDDGFLYIVYSGENTFGYAVFNKRNHIIFFSFISCASSCMMRTKCL